MRAAASGEPHGPVSPALDTPPCDSGGVDVHRRRWAGGGSAMRRYLPLVLVLLVVTGCSGDDPEPAPEPTVTAPSASEKRLVPGTSVELTATVTGVLSATAFLVADTDLPPDGQVVVSDTPVTVRVIELVTVTGRVEQVDAAAFSRYGISDPQVFERSGGVVIVATAVRRYLPESAAPAPGSPAPGLPSASPSGSPG
jgi:hypothetical protein